MYIDGGSDDITLWWGRSHLWRHEQPEAAAPRLRESIDSLRPPLAIVTDGRTFNFHGAAILFGTYREKTPWNRAVHEIVVYYFCMCVCVSISLWTRNNTHLLWLLGNLWATASLYRPWPAHNAYSWTIIRRIKKDVEGWRSRRWNRQIFHLDVVNGASARVYKKDIEVRTGPIQL